MRFGKNSLFQDAPDRNIALVLVVLTDCHYFSILCQSDGIGNPCIDGNDACPAANVAFMIKIGADRNHFESDRMKRSGGDDGWSRSFYGGSSGADPGLLNCSGAGTGNR